VGSASEIKKQFDSLFFSISARPAHLAGGTGELTPASSLIAFRKNAW
jgi:hypothetical protein